MGNYHAAAPPAAGAAVDGIPSARIASADSEEAVP